MAVCGALALAGAAHATEPAAEPPLAQTLAQSSIRAAVAQPGVIVCRQLQVGIAERDWIRGEVIDVAGDAIAVRIEETGRFPHILRDVPVLPGTVLWNSVALWTPCI